MKVVLTDGTEIFDRGEMTPDELREANRQAERASVGNIYWTTVIPDEPARS